MRVLSRLIPVLVAVLLGLGAAAAYLAVAESRYEGEAKLQVVPLSADDETFEGFGLPRGPGAVETVADLVERPAVVDAAAVRLRLEREDVLDAVTVDADDESSVVGVRARTGDATRAAQIANAVAQEFVAERSAQFQGELNRTIARLREELRSVPASERDEPPADAVVARLTALRGLVGEPDPTVRVAGTAVADDRVVWPRPAPVLAVALLGSLLLGLAVSALLRPRVPVAAAAGADGVGAAGRRETLLAERVRAVTQRERALARRAGELAGREAELAARAGDLDGREQTLAERERALGARREELDERERELEEREAARAPEPQPAPEPEPEPTPPAAPGEPSAGGAWSLLALERLVAERGAEFPDRAEEWDAYLFFLREHASPEGVLPPSFDALVEDTFRELLG